MLSLVRDDEVVLDRWVVDLSGANGDSGLIPRQALSLDLIGREDFERSNDLNQWSVTETTAVTRTTATAFTGNAALAVSASGPSDQSVTWTSWHQPLQADYLIGQVYWPASDEAFVIWAQICIIDLWQCVNLPKTPGRWNTFVIDLAAMGANAKQWQGVTFQGSIKGAGTAKPYVFYLDDLQVYSTRKSTQ